MCRVCLLLVFAVLTQFSSSNAQLSEPEGLFNFNYSDWSRLNVSLNANVSELLQNYGNESAVTIDLEDSISAVSRKIWYYSCPVQRSGPWFCSKEVAFRAKYFARFRVVRKNNSLPATSTGTLRRARVQYDTLFTSAVESLNSTSAMLLEAPMILHLDVSETLVNFTYRVRTLWEIEAERLLSSRLYHFVLHCAEPRCAFTPRSFVHSQLNDSQGLQYFHFDGLLPGRNWTLETWCEFPLSKLANPHDFVNFKTAGSSSADSQLVTRTEPAETAFQLAVSLLLLALLAGSVVSAFAI